MGIMDAPYDLTGIVNQTDLPKLAEATNTILHGYYFGIFTLLIVALVCFVYMVGKRYSIATSLSASGWLVAILALFLRPLNLINNTIFWISIFLLPACVLLLWWGGRD